MGQLLEDVRASPDQALSGRRVVNMVSDQTANPLGQPLCPKPCCHHAAAESPLRQSVCMPFPHPVAKRSNPNTYGARANLSGGVVPAYNSSATTVRYVAVCVGWGCGDCATDRPIHHNPCVARASRITGIVRTVLSASSAWRGRPVPYQPAMPENPRRATHDARTTVRILCTSA